MNFTKEDYYRMYEARYSPNMQGNSTGIVSIIRGTFVEVFQYFRFNLASIIFFIPVLFLNYLPLVICKLCENSKK